MEAHYDKFFKLAILGFILIIIGFLVIMFSSITLFMQSSSNASVSGGFIILIGPIPIGLAFGEYNWLIMLILLILAIVVIVIVFILSRYAKL